MIVALILQLFYRLNSIYLPNYILDLLKHIKLYESLSVFQNDFNS